MSPEITITDADAKAVTAKAITPPTLKFCPVCGGRLVPGGKTFTNKNGSTLVADSYCEKGDYMNNIRVSKPTS